MRETNVCLNRVFRFYKSYIKFLSRGLTQTFVLVKKVCDEKRKKETKKDKKMTGALYKLSQRSERGRLSLKQGLMDRFIVGDIDSV